MNLDYTEQKEPQQEALQTSDGLPMESDRIDLSLFSSPDCLINIHEEGQNWCLEWVELLDQTDKHDELVRHESKLLCADETLALPGHFFHLTNLDTGQTILLIKEAPGRASQTLSYPFDFLLILNDGRLNTGIFGTGCTSKHDTRPYTAKLIRGVDSLWSEWLQAYDADLRTVWTGWSYQQVGTIMSNTWGDRNRDERVCESFILSEIYLAADMKLDMVQIDDGWQSGRTMNSGLVLGNGVWEGYYSINKSFWEPDAGKFPHGLLMLANTAAQAGIGLSLWFSPDSSDDFSNWKKDLETLLDIKRRHGISTFKLDGVKLRNKNAEVNYLSLLSELGRENIDYILDVTDEKRLGYLYEKQRGLLFVENRYTDRGNYYPWKSLRNLWDLSHYIPAPRLQFEVLNPCRNTGMYINAADELLSPENVPLDWSFWSTVPSNPLIWMELSGLPSTERALLAGAIGHFRSIRESLTRCRVIPIGDRPDGYSSSAFLWVDADSGDFEYILVLTQANAEASIVLNLMDDRYPHRPTQAYLNTLLGAHQTWGTPSASSELKMKVIASSAESNGLNCRIENNNLLVVLNNQPWQYIMLQIER